MNNPRPPSQRDIAHALGVSRMAVSRAFKPGSEISESLRNRVLSKARELGYRPDPLLTEVMGHFARRKHGLHRETVGVLWWETPPAATGSHWYAQEIKTGVEEAARHHGLSVDHINVAREKRGLQRVLDARGIRSLVITPSFRQTHATLDLDWSRLSAVAAGNSIREPRIHRVMHNHYTSAVRAFQEVAGLGYRRPALVVRKIAEARNRNSYIAAFLAATGGSGARRILQLENEPDSHLLSWLKQQTFDCLVAGDDSVAAPLVRAWLSDHSHPLVSLDRGPRSHADFGIRQHPRSLGEWSIDLLMQLRLRGQTGVPAEPATIAIEGAWISARQSGLNKGATPR